MFPKVQLFLTLGALLMADSVSAHGHVMSWIIDGTAHAGFNPSNAKLYGATAERPTLNENQGFTDYTSPIVACGGSDPGTGIQNLDIKGGSKVVAKWDTWPTSHKGPITQWMANCGAANCDGIDAASLDWFKISEDGFDGTLWAGEKLGNTKEWAFNIPSDLASGAYLVRHDVVAMHTPNQPQAYPYCFQANLVSSGSVVPTLTTTFPEAYTVNTDFLTWNLYGGDQSAFVNYGPGVYSGGGTSPAPAPAPAPSASASSSVASSAPASSSVAVTSASAPAASSSEVVVPSATEEYPAESTASTPTESEPVETASAPASSASAPVESASTSSASSAPAAPSASTPITPAPGGDGAMGGAAPAITEDGTRFKVNGGSYNTKADAVYASCMSQMNACKNWANSLPNAEVGAAFSSCDTQVATCTSTSKKRDVINRYSKRSLLVL